LTVAFFLSASLGGRAQDAPAVTSDGGSADVIALLNQEKPDPDEAARLAADADREIPPNLADADRGQAYYHRGQARAQSGRLNDAVADVEEALKLSKGQNYKRVTSRYQQFLHRLLLRLGDFKRAVPIMMTEIRGLERVEPSRLFGLYSELAHVEGAAENMEAIERIDRNIHGLLVQSRSWAAATTDPFRPGYQSSVDDVDGYLYELKSRYAEAEAVYGHGRQAQTESLSHYDEQVNLEGVDYPPREELERFVDVFQLNEARMKVLQGRALEGEVDAREVLLRRLQRLGKYHEETGAAVAVLAQALEGEGRDEDAEKLTQAALDIFRSVGLPDDSARIIGNLQRLAHILDDRNLPDEAQKIYDQIDRLVAGWDPARREAVVNEAPRLKQLIRTGRAGAAVDLASRKLDRERARSGDNSPATAVVRGYLASALAKAGRGSEAAAAFKAAIPILLESARQEENDDSLTAGAIANRNRYILESYVDLLARDSSIAGAATADETIGLADKLRGQAVQRALAQALARSAAKDPALGGLARTEQDLSKQLNGAVADLANLLAQPSDQRDAKAVKGLQAKVAKLHTDHATAAAALAKRFPAYANQIDPPPARAADIRAVLREGEALLSFYFGEDASFVWVVAKNGPVAFRELPITSTELDQKVAKLREALEPEAASVSEIPPFDVALAHSLYVSLLQGVEDAWRPARNLIVVANGALGFLPLGLLPTAPIELAADPSLLFAEYRRVPWLARDHGITVMPSVSALRALRTTAVADAHREKLMGFGDPYFNAAQAAEAANGGLVAAGQPPADQTSPDSPELAAATPAAAVTRGVPLKLRSSFPPGIFDVNLANLPRLPDTAEELRAIATALGVDPAMALKLGKDANERVVKSTKLSAYRIVAFATHGLMADDIDGLDQPALALTAPRVAGISGTGLLTMEDILALKLNADWVVLSACNTGAGAGEGAEAASGLGRAFFYAGARTLLVTNWSVHSQSARLLIVDVFQRQASDPKLTRSEALRRAMMGLLDGPGFVDDGGKTLFTYAHPLFWAPYSVIGDGT
jgi:CHAT domain-containing protein/tetratricopeptide (TPR) repeat protein